MKLKDALKKFNFLKRLDLSDKVIANAANHLARTLLGSTEIYLTPLAKSCDPVYVLVDWDEIFKNNSHRMNSVLLELERANRSKFGARSIAVPWSARVNSLKESFSNQVPNHEPKFSFTPGNGELRPASYKTAIDRMKSNSSSGFPFLSSKGKCLDLLNSNFDYYLDRKDPCMLYTRTTEGRKTRNVWGYPMADSLYEMLFYAPLLTLQKTKFYRAALISPDAVAQGITEIMNKAAKSDKFLYSVDFAAFDASVRYQYIRCAFVYIKSCYTPACYPLLDYVCERICTIPIVTPTGIYRGFHGVPSGSTFTNEVDSIVQLGVALTCSFIHEDECQIQGDDGVYLIAEENIPAFQAAFKYAGLKLETTKSRLSKDYVLFCQNLYHRDYTNDGVVPGIYPTYRAINRILFMERFVNLKLLGLNGKDYFGIRCLTILENCKHHPLFEDLVRFVLAREKFSLDISVDSLTKYCSYISSDNHTSTAVNHQYGSQVNGIQNFASYKLIRKILDEEAAAAPIGDNKEGANLDI